MRFLTLAALAALTLGMMDVRPADAARSSEAKQSSSQYKAQKRAERRAAKAERRAAHRSKRAARHAHAKPRAATSRRAAKRSATRRTAASRPATRRRQATRRQQAQVPVKRRATTSASLSSGGGSHGIASYYWQPQRVASGGMFNPNALTAAHRTLPFGTKVRVTNKRNGKSVVVTINDRGPFIKGRIIDLSKRAAGVIGMQGAGLAPVSVHVVGRG